MYNRLYLKAFYCNPQSQNDDIIEQLKNKELTIMEIYPESDPDFQSLRKFGITPELYFHKMPSQKSRKSILELLNSYLQLCIKEYHSLVHDNIKEYDTYITWTENGVLPNNAFSIETIEWVVNQKHKIGVKVDYRIKNIVTKIFAIDLFMENEGQLFLNFDGYIDKEVASPLNDEYFIFKNSDYNIS